MTSKEITNPGTGIRLVRSILLSAVLLFSLSSARAQYTNFSVVIGEVTGVESNYISFSVQETVYGNCPLGDIRISMSFFAVRLFQTGNHFMCMLAGNEYMGYSLSNSNAAEVYREADGNWIFAPYSGGQFYIDSFEDFGRKVNVPQSESIPLDDFLVLQQRANSIMRLYNPDLKDNDFYELTDSTAVPLYGMDVKHIAEFWISETKSGSKNVPVPLDSGKPHRSVDMGLSVEWADCNLGAERPQDKGAYFAWGETVQKDTYTPSNYKWCDMGRGIITKYYPTDILPLHGDGYDIMYDPILPTGGEADDLTGLEAADDAVRQNWGDGWRMPTSAEMKELIDNCDWEWTVTDDGIKGYMVTSRINGNSIFLPISGCYSESGMMGDNYNRVRYGFYMSSSLSKQFREECVNLRFDNRRVDLSSSQRSNGLVIRPVKVQASPDDNAHEVFYRCPNAINLLMKYAPENFVCGYVVSDQGWPPLSCLFLVNENNRFSLVFQKAGKTETIDIGADLADRLASSVSHNLKTSKTNLTTSKTIKTIDDVVIFDGGNSAYAFAPGDAAEYFIDNSEDIPDKIWSEQVSRFGISKLSSIPSPVMVVEDMPEFPGGGEGLKDYLKTNVIYPQEAKEKGITGRVLVSFIVERDGSLTDIKIKKSVDPILDNEALRVVSGMPAWKPGKTRDKLYRVICTVPVSFQL